MCLLASHNLAITAFKNNFKFIIICYEMKLQKIIKKENEFIHYKKLKIDKSFIDSNLCCEIEKNKKIGKIKKIIYLTSSSFMIEEKQFIAISVFQF
jgi:hypothetical protein